MTLHKSTYSADTIIFGGIEEKAYFVFSNIQGIQHPRLTLPTAILMRITGCTAPELALNKKFDMENRLGRFGNEGFLECGAR